MVARGERRIHRRHSAQSVAVSLAGRFIVKNVVRAWAIRPDLAWPFGTVDRFAGLVPYRPAVRVERLRLASCVAERIQTAGSRTQRAILYLHGGAFGYRMLPSHDDCAGCWIAAAAPEQIVVAGDSAGGTTLAALQSDMAKPAGIAAISPFTDVDPTAKLRHRNADRCAMSPPGALPAFTRCLRRSRGRRPVVTAAGVRCDLHLWHGQIHDFPLAAGGRSATSVTSSGPSPMSCPVPI